mgnify:CR=1 FL=1
MGITADGSVSLSDWHNDTWAADPERPINTNQPQAHSDGSRQTQSAGPIDKSERNIPIQATIATLLSVRDSVLTMIYATDQCSAEAITSNAPVSMIAKPGRRMISIPAKPRPMAAHLLR